MDKAPLSLSWLCKIIPFSQTLTDCSIWPKLSFLSHGVFILFASAAFDLLWPHAHYNFDLCFSWCLFFCGVCPCPALLIASFLPPALIFFFHFFIFFIFFGLPAFTVLSSSRSMGEFATALPLQGAHSKSLSGLALLAAYTLFHHL